MIEDVVGGVFRFIGSVIADVVFELLIKGPGYLVVKQFSKRSPNPDGFIVVLVGLLFWAFVGVAGYFVYQEISGAAMLD